MDDQRKDLQKGTALNNYRPIMGLPMIWKILTAQIRKIYYSLISHELFLEKQNGWHKETRRRGELLYIDQHILKESKMR